MEYVSHPLIKEGTIEKRAYQEKILASIADKSSLVVLPTGLGKTIIAAMLVAHRLSNKGGKILFLAPTRPLVVQHRETFVNIFDMDPQSLVLFTGSTPPLKREEGYKGASMVFATPQVIENDILTGRVDPKDYSLAIIDEAHRAVGEYSYVYIAKRYNEDNPQGLILAITASPGYDRSKVKEIMANLGISNVHLENETSPEVMPYVHEIEMEWIKLDFPRELEKARLLIRSVYDEKIDLLMKFKLTSKPRQYINRKDLLAMGEKLRKSLNSNKGGHGNYYTAIKAQAAAVKLSHSLELLETQGADAFLSYFEKVKKQRSKTSKELILDGRVTRALMAASKYEEVHPKMKKLQEVLSELGAGQTAIVFSQYRDTTKRIEEMIAELDGIRPVRFIGQTKREDDEGLSQKKQKEILDKFRDGEYNVLVATSVAEEGLDIPSVDLVVFFEPIPSEIRTIQRRGRTGRRRTGKAYIMAMKGTVDEAYLKVAKDKEIKMQKVMTLMDSKVPKSDNQSKLDHYVAEKPLVICDNRENPQIIKLLSQRSKIEVRTLQVGDYVLSDRIGVERKSTTDFLRSLFDNKLFEQIGSLSRSFERPLLILEGDDLLSKKQTSRSSVRNALISIIVDFGVGVIATRNMIETADYIVEMAIREQIKEGRVPKVRGEKRTMSKREGMSYIVEGLPNVSSTLARRLLEHFGSVEAIFLASEEDLKLVEGIGEKTAKGIRDILSARYEG